ncbi:hypothetical protein B0T14DRAFT_332398 [Immersiella caudata]|uniref:Uncharacterized protein n=1 Tax=Immersiella caudata TaxID=314043 RepID=A0AA39U4G6_9PEZI|nr:hypothetical protein B0T14DRAFT_332398 [Immersiella caudata]
MELDSASWPRAANFDGKGPRSLVAMCLRGLAKDLTENEAYIPLDDENVPPSLLLRLFRELKLRWRYHEDIPLHSWKILSKAIGLATARDADWTQRGEVPAELLRHRRTISNVNGDLQTYVKEYRSPAPEPRLASSMLEFVVSLTIDGVSTFQPQQLLSLATLNNLVHLHIVSERPHSTERGHVTDSLLRGWSEMNNVFPMLQILKFTNSRDLSYRSVRYVSVFPCLQVYEILDPNIPAFEGYREWGDSAELHGWHFEIPKWPSPCAKVEPMSGQSRSLPDGTYISQPDNPLASLELVGEFSTVNCGGSLLEYLGHALRLTLSRPTFRDGNQRGVQPQGKGKDLSRKDRQLPERRKQKAQKSLRAGKRMKVDDMLGSFGIPRSGGS